MADTSFQFNLKEIKRDLKRAVQDCSRRGLVHSTKWLSELNFALRDIKIDQDQEDSSSKKNVSISEEDEDLYNLAKSYFDLKELDRFLHLYSRYLSGERKKLHDMTDCSLEPDAAQSPSLLELVSELRREHKSQKLDAYALYLYGIVLKRLELIKQAQEVLVSAIHMEPMHWGAWIELSSLISDKGSATALVLPNHWMKQFFLGHTFLDQQLNESALDIYLSLSQNGFSKSTYVSAQIAIAYHNHRELDTAIATFRTLQKEDPYRLDNLDAYSNLLYVKDLRVELSHLAHHSWEVDKYRVETCCVVGNYYSLRGEHQKAVMYFQRALKLNPQYLSAWTLLGQEFMEMKNTTAAIQSYRQATEANRRDFRAWYGLGQTYEILKMPFYCLYYYKQAQQLRPNDSRMLIALGETYEKLEKIQEALKCFFKARSVGDIEGVALLRMAKLYDKLGESEQAAAAFSEYVKDSDLAHWQSGDVSEVSQAYKYLANHFVKCGHFEEAAEYAQKCMDYEETREEGKALLKTIAQSRTQADGEMLVSRFSEKKSIQDYDYCYYLILCCRHQFEVIRKEP